MKPLIAICRLFVGVLFIVSGLIKANDPLGFSYKFDEYFDVFGTPFLLPFSLYLSIFICVIEITLGFATLTGYRMKQVSWILLILILFFTWLTGYSALTGKVTDCGCFGDAVKLTPKQSFIKDLILLSLIDIIFWKRKIINPLFVEPIGKAATAGIALFSLGFTIFCYTHLPLKDFRPYSVGKNIAGQMSTPEGAQPDIFEVTYTLKNKKSGDLKKVTSNDYITQKIWEDSTWELLADKTENILVEEGYHPPIHDFSIRTTEGTDITDSILTMDGYMFWIIAYDLNKTNRSHITELNVLSEECMKNNVPVIALTASNDRVIDQFKHETQTLCDFYLTDETALKTMIRSNPGLMLLKKGTVVALWHHNDIPTFEEVREKFLRQRRMISD